MIVNKESNTQVPIIKQKDKPIEITLDDSDSGSV